MTMVHTGDRFISARTVKSEACSNFETKGEIFSSYITTTTHLDKGYISMGGEDFYQ